MMHDGASDLVFFLHRRDGLRGIDARAALTAAFGVSDERVFQLIGKAEVMLADFGELLANAESVRVNDCCWHPRWSRTYQRRASRTVPCLIDVATGLSKAFPKRVMDNR
jgi:hypothetical protein